MKHAPFEANLENVSISTANQIRNEFQTIAQNLGIPLKETNIDTLKHQFKRAKLQNRTQTLNTCDNIVTTVAQHYNSRTEPILSESRKQPETQQRHIAMWLCRNFTDASYPEIGLIFGRHHTTVISAVENIEWEINAGNQTLTKDLDNLSQKLKTP